MKKIVSSDNFQRSITKKNSHYKKIGYNINVLQQNACLVVRPKKNYCVVRVTAEKTLGRVDRFFFSAMAHMLDDKKTAF